VKCLVHGPGARRAAERYTEIRYEELVSHPEEILRPLFTWLGEPWDDTVLALEGGGGRELKDEGQERREWLGTSDGGWVADGESARPGKDPEALEADRFRPAGVFASSVGVGKRPLNAPYLLQLRLTSGSLMRELGYR